MFERAAVPVRMVRRRPRGARREHASTRRRARARVAELWTGSSRRCSSPRPAAGDSTICAAGGAPGRRQRFTPTASGARCQLGTIRHPLVPDQSVRANRHRRPVNRGSNEMTQWPRTSSADSSRRSPSSSASPSSASPSCSWRPASPIDRFRAPNVRPETLENLIRLYGLDEPVYEQFVELDHGLRPVLARRTRGATASSTAGPCATRSSTACRRRSCSAAPRSLVTVIVADPDRHPGRRQAVQLGRQGRSPPSPRSATPSRRSCSACTSPTSARSSSAASSPASAWSACRREGRGTPLDVAWHMVLPVSSPGDPADRRLVALRARQDARGPEPGLRAHRQGQGAERRRKVTSSTRCATRSSRSSPCSG